MIRLSKTSKLNARSWSLQAGETCPASYDENGELVPACAGCYAKSGNYRYPNVKTPRIENREDWKRIEWVRDMVAELDNDRYFRWFDSGDMYHQALGWKIVEVMKATPHVKHWIPSRMFKFQKFKPILDAMQSLDNVAVRWSSDSIQGEFESHHGSTIIPSHDTETTAFICQAYNHGGNCNGCRACWDKSISVIAYPAHGRKMIKLIEVKP